MIFDDSAEEFFAYQQASFESPDLRPIPLSMSGFDKSSALEGMINLQAAAAAFPESNAFGHYLQPVYPTQLANQHVMLTPDEQVKQGLYADAEFGYPVEFVDSREMMPMYPMERSVVSSMSEPEQQSRKRKSSLDLEYAEPQPRKKAVVAQLKLQDINGDLYDLSAQTSPYSSVVPTPGNSISCQGGQEAPSPRFRHQYSTSNASQVSLPAPSPHTPCWSPSFTTVKTDQSPRAPMTPAPRPASTSSAYSSHPKLVRTSTIPQQASPGLATPVAVGIHSQAFNPYAMYPHNKATLRLNGDLDAVAFNWSAEELEACRKLIVFSRSQTGSTIDAEFKTVAPQDWQRTDITINCIWWKERKEAFVTSVDTIALLEQLVAVRFTVEEKNRIRRNLEGFRPLTVSKAKPDSEEFFKVIMGFANPKPRNIEKDVKVFPWKILAHALKKIIGKYSASYASTASTIAPQSANVYTSSDFAGEYNYLPVSSTELISNDVQPAPMPMVCYGPELSVEHPSVAMTRGPDLSVQVPVMGPAYHIVPNGYGYEAMQHLPHTISMTPHPMSAPAPHLHTGWEYQHLGPPQMGPASAPPHTAYPRGHIETAELVAPGYHVHPQ